MTFEHHEDIETLNGNSKVWRYIALEKFADLLLNERLIFTQIDTLPDRYERDFPLGVIASRRTMLEKQGLPGDRIQKMLQEFRDTHVAGLRSFWTPLQSRYVPTGALLHLQIRIRK